MYRLKWAGLLPFARLVESTKACPRTLIDQSLLTCLVDRWRPETHTCHFRWGEMAPTLQDVSMLLGLPLAGQAIGPLATPATWATDMAARFEGINPHPDYPPFGIESHGPKFEWLLTFQVRSLSLINFLSHSIFNSAFAHAPSCFECSYRSFLMAYR
jgi:hypothetical protein